MLTKEEKLAILSKAIDEGADIWIDFNDMQPAQAETRIKEYAQQMGTEVRNGYKWHTTESFDSMKVATFINEENPCITYSNDGYTWSETGITNPIDRPPTIKSFFSDVHLVYREDLNRMECWYREFNNDSASNKYREETIHRMTSTNGINWSNKQTLFSVNSFGDAALSPSVIYDENKYKIWLVYKREGLKYYESTDGTNWQFIRDVNVDTSDDVYKVWHADVVKTTKGFEFVACYQYNGLFDRNNFIAYAKSSDNITYSTPERILLNGYEGNFDSLELYRPCLVRKPDSIMLYYGAQKSPKTWAIGLVEAPSINHLKSLILED